MSLYSGALATAHALAAIGVAVKYAPTRTVRRPGCPRADSPTTPGAAGYQRGKLGGEPVHLLIDRGCSQPVSANTAASRPGSVPSQAMSANTVD
ncbi:hypothetical protein [Mycobacteroides abscessus]|uniref:hypothetical protein n=1 Tax=Mycobacteroides abscessus TaxID=36809 RepID=UPI00142DE884|nr:hypothetical protein [Mycobacteroides abscessus]